MNEREGESEDAIPGEFRFLLDDLQYSILHLIDGLKLGQTQAALVRDVIHTSLALGVLTVNTLRGKQNMLLLLINILLTVL